LSAGGLLSIDVIYVSRRVILPIYLMAAVIEVLILIAWAWVAWHLVKDRPGHTLPERTCNKTRLLPQVTCPD
jgi:hypothetical protein